MDQKNYSADVIIVGGGLSGIVSSLELLNLGKKVVLFERATKEYFGGLAKESFGGMFFVNTPVQKRAGIKDSPELAFKDWKRVANFGQEDEYPKAWAKSYVYHCTEYVYQWLLKEGIRFLPAVHWVERGLFTPGNSYPRFHIVWGTGKGLIDKLVENLFKHPNAKDKLRIHYSHKVETLLHEGDSVSGVLVKNETNGKLFEVNSNSVILSSGGIGGNIAKMKAHWYKPWGAPPEKILNGALPGVDGHMIDEAEKAHANVTHLDKMWPYAAGVQHPRPRIPNHGLSLVPPKSALWLNFKGERIGPMPLVTAYDTRFLVEQICKQEKKYSWQVLNRKIADKELAISGAEFNQSIRDKKIIPFLKTFLFGNKALVDDMLENCQDFIVADNIEELADKMNTLTGDNDVDLDKLRESILDYDQNIARGPSYYNDEQLRRIAHARRYKGDKMRTSKFQKISDPKAGPLIAIREFIVSRKTLGGIQTDLSCRVLNKDGKVIKGLYACGEAAGFGGGGMHGQGALEGTFLGGCVLTARIAAYSICDKKLIKE